MKLFKYLLIAVMSLVFVHPAKAQWHDNDSCNRDMQGGFENATGSGTNGAMVVRYFITTHYQAANLEEVKKTLATVETSMLNEELAKEGSSIRFESTDFNNPVNLNFTIYLDVYSFGDGSYKVYVCFHGWGRNHLFRTSSSQTDLENAFREAANETAGRVTKGWVCHN